MKNVTIDEQLRTLADQVALKTLVDTCSNLADQKDVESQIMLFTEDATVDSYIDGKLVSSLKGRSEILHAFDAYLSRFKTVYHFNGQQTVELAGDQATGVSYCLVVLITDEDGKMIRSTSGVTYNDEYFHSDGEWLISKRVSHFIWRDRKEMGK